jgi:hypothetical protein
MFGMTGPMRALRVRVRAPRARAVARGGGDLGLGRGPGVRGGGTWSGTRGGSFLAGMGIIRDSKKLSLYDSSHLTAEAPAGKLEPGLLNFNTHKDCSWHVR